MDKMKREGLWAPGHAVMYRGLRAVLDERGYPLVEGNSLGNVQAFTRAVAKADFLFTQREAPRGWAAVFHEPSGLTLLQLWRQWTQDKGMQAGESGGDGQRQDSG